MGKKFEIKGNDISDGYHTFDELYQHRILLFLALIKSLSFDGVTTMKYRPDHYEGWDAVYLELGGNPRKQISYHLPSSYRNIVASHCDLADDNYKWDGHSSKDVIDRLYNYVNEYIGI